MFVNAALTEIMEEGGQPARLARYEANAKELHAGMAKLGFTTYLSPDKQGCIISTFRECSAAPHCALVRCGCCLGQIEPSHLHFLTPSHPCVPCWCHQRLSFHSMFRGCVVSCAG